MNFVNILIIILLITIVSIQCNNSTADDYNYDDETTTTTIAASSGNDDYEETNYDYDEEHNNDAAATTSDEQQPYKCPDVCICKFHKIEDATSVTTTTTATATVTSDESSDDYDYDYSDKDSYEIDVDCSNRSLSSLNNIFDDEFPVESIVKLNLSSNLFETLKLGDFELFQSLKVFDLSSNLKLRTLPTINLLKNFQDLHELYLDNLQLSQNFCLNCKAVRRHFNYFNKSGIQVSLENVKCGGSMMSSSNDDVNLQMCFEQHDKVLIMEPKQNQIIFEGDSINLKCRFNKDYLNNTINWYLNNTRVSSNGVQIRQNSSYSELSVFSLNSRRHTGAWKCMSGDLKVKSEIFIQVLATTKLADEETQVYCPDLVTVTSRGAFKWNKTAELNTTVEQNCFINSEQTAKYECRMQNDNKTASWMNLNVSKCEFESNLTRYLNSLLKNSSNLNLNFKLNMTKSNIIDYHLIIQLIQAKFRLENRNNMNLGKFLVDFYNFLSNQTLDVNSFADFNPFEFNLSLRAFFQMLNFYMFSFRSTLNTQYLVVNQPVIIYRQSNLLVYYLADIPLCSSILSVDLSSGSQNKTLQFELQSLQNSALVDNDLAVLLTKFSWKKIRFFNYKDRYSDNLKNYDLIYSLTGPILQQWQVYNQNTSQFTCEFMSLSKNQSLLNTKCEFKVKQRVNLALKWSNSTQNEAKFYYFNEKFIYFSSISSFVFLLINIIAYLVNNKHILMPVKFKHCLINIWSCQLIQILLNLLLLIQIDLKPLCIINSLLEHIFILSTFLWFLIYTIELYKKLVKLHEGNLNPVIEQVPNHDDDEGTENGDEINKKHKPIVHLYMIALALPVFLCLISYTSTPKYVNFEYSYCFLTQLDILLITFILPIVICLILIIIFSVLILRVYSLIMKNLEIEQDEVKSGVIEDEGEEVDTKFSNQYSIDSIMDTQYRPKIQLAFILITLTIYILMEICLQLEIYKSKFMNIDQIDSSLFIYCYSLLLLIYSIITFSFYFLTRNDTFTSLKKFDLFRKRRNYYFEQKKGDEEEEEEDIPSIDDADDESISSCEKKNVECTTPNNSQEEEVAVVAEEEKKVEDCNGDEEVVNTQSNSPSTIQYIDETAAATASNYSFSAEQQQQQQQLKRKSHIRNGSVLSGQFNGEQQLLINSLIQQEPVPTTTSTTMTNTINRRGAPIYVYVDHNYEDKLIRKVKSPTLSSSVEQSHPQQQQQQQQGIWLNKFYESDKPLFKNETSV